MSKQQKTVSLKQLKSWGQALGFTDLGVTHTNLSAAEAHLFSWLKAGMHGDMHYMAAHKDKRSRPDNLLPGTVSIISVRMDYLRKSAQPTAQHLQQSNRAYIARYALGRDYHRLMRKKLQKLAEQIATVTGPFVYRAFTDSAPVMEKAIAANAGLGWIGKNTLLLNRHAGSWFFLGELYTGLQLPVGQPSSNHCGSCSRCMEVCPTGAIIAPYRLDARLCIAYLTIESHGPIPLQLRPLIGNRVFGCDDCQLYCPWNRFPHYTEEDAFKVRHGLDQAELLELFTWDEKTFNKNSEGTVLRRLGYERWLRNLAVGLGNASSQADIIEALRAKQNHPSALVREHVRWALSRQLSNTPDNSATLA